jgi:hypothetical protein
MTRVVVADFSKGAPAGVRYWENWWQSQVLDGWHDEGDICLAGDFMGLGRDQVLFINRQPQGGRVLIADFAGSGLATPVYVEMWGQSQILGGWHDLGDVQRAGKFLVQAEAGHDQVLFINRQRGGGRIMVTDFSNGPPASALFSQDWGTSASSWLNGWHDDGDWQLVGDFIGLAHKQILFINRQSGGGGATVVTLYGYSPVVRYRDFLGAAGVVKWFPQR